MVPSILFIYIIWEREYISVYILETKIYIKLCCVCNCIIVLTVYFNQWGTIQYNTIQSKHRAEQWMVKDFARAVCDVE